MARAIDIIKGLEILCRYHPHGTDASLGGAEHDLSHGIDIGDTEITDEDKAALESHRWFYADGDEEGWYHFA